MTKRSYDLIRLHEGVMTATRIMDYNGKLFSIVRCVILPCYWTETDTSRDARQFVNIMITNYEFTFSIRHVKKFPIFSFHFTLVLRLQTYFGKYSRRNQIHGWILASPSSTEFEIFFWRHTHLIRDAASDVKSSTHIAEYLVIIFRCRLADRYTCR